VLQHVHIGPTPCIWELKSIFDGVRCAAAARGWNHKQRRSGDLGGKVDVPSVACQKESTKVKYNDKEGGPNAFSNYGRLQLLIFNVYGTLLDCSLLLERNPNSKIRTSLKTETRRVVF
jgi:hypothetical protein